MKINPVEIKTKAATLAAFVISGAMLGWLAQEGPLFIGALPDWAEVPIGGAVASLVVWLTAFNTRHRPDAMSPSAVSAVMRRGARPEV